MVSYVCFWKAEQNSYLFLFNCADVNECNSDDLNNCHENANCTNTEGSFTCSCKPGYTGDGVTCTSKLVMIIAFLFSFSGSIVTCFPSMFIDIDECEMGTHTCSSNASCTDTDGSFNCTCREGYEGDGFNCTGMK